MEVYFLRHGEAVEIGEEGVTCDFDRFLTEKGQNQARNAGLALLKMDIEFNCILTSPAERAMQTAEIVAETMEAGNRVMECEGLWSGDLEQVFQFATRKRQDRICLVGHEPIIGDLIGWLITRKHEVIVPLKKGGLAKVDVDWLPPRYLGELRFILNPKQLRLIAE